MQDHYHAPQIAPDGTLTTEPLPAGEYWIGDPDHAFSGKLRDRLANARASADGPVVEFLGAACFIAATAAPYGTFRSTLGVLSIDTGQIAALPLEILNSSRAQQMGHVLRFPKPFRAGWQNGRFVIGHVHVGTPAEAA